MSVIKCFTISLLAGLCTTLGGGIAVKFHRKIQPVSFAGALSFAAGIMILISFVEVYNEGLEQLLAWPLKEKQAKIVALTAFLSGWAVASFLDGVLNLLLPSSQNLKTTSGEAPADLQQQQQQRQHGSPQMIISHSPAMSKVTSLETRAAAAAAAAVVSDESDQGQLSQGCGMSKNLAKKASNLWCALYSAPFVCAMRGAHHQVTKAQKDKVKEQFYNDQIGLTKIGYFTAFVLALHNVPEGIATFFTASSDDVKLSITLAMAVGIHNIPEGVAVAVPIYFGTRRPGLALWYTFLSGMAEPLGGLLAYTLLKSGSSTALSPQVLGITLLMTCGIMVNVAIKELFVTAIRYDVANDITTVAFFGGMCTMAVSLMLLTLFFSE